jgi:hypothetical protein
VQKKLKLKQRTTNAVWSCRVPGRMTFGVLKYSDVAGSALPNGVRWYGKVRSKVLYVPPVMPHLLNDADVVIVTLSEYQTWLTCTFIPSNCLA